MKAIRANDWCEPNGLTVEEIPQPEPGPRDVSIKVESASLNFPDMLIISGKYQVKPDLPYTPGFEIAGVVEKAGPQVTGVAPGQRVLAQLPGGGFAEFAVAEESAVRAIPESMSFDEAAAFPMVYQTSYFGLVHRAALREGETVLVHSAAGGVGLTAVQLARALGAGTIIGTAGSDEKLRAILDNGADVAINYREQDFVEIVNRETNGRGADVIYDPVGGEVAERSTKCIAFEGRLIIVGFTSGKFPNFASNHILIKNYTVLGLHWGFYRKRNDPRIEEAWLALFELYNLGKIKPVIGARYHMTEAADAMNHLASRNAVGKIVLHW